MSKIYIPALLFIFLCYSSLFVFVFWFANSKCEIYNQETGTKGEIEETKAQNSDKYEFPPFDWGVAPNITLKIDLHTHTKFSDGNMWPIDLIYYQNSTGRNATAITDHNTVEGSLNGSRITQIYNISMPIITGEEWSGGRTRQTPLHIVMLFINRTLETERFPENGIEAIEECHKMGGIVIWAHPWRGYGCAEQQSYPDVLPHIDGIEWKPENSSWILSLALEYDLFVVYSSDIHFSGQREERFSHIRVDDTSIESIKWSLRTGNIWLNVPNSSNYVDITYPNGGGPGLYGRTWFGLPVGVKIQ